MAETTPATPAKGKATATGLGLSSVLSTLMADLNKHALVEWGLDGIETHQVDGHRTKFSSQGLAELRKQVKSKWATMGGHASAQIFPSRLDKWLSKFEGASNKTFRLTSRAAILEFKHNFYAVQGFPPLSEDEPLCDYLARCEAASATFLSPLHVTVTKSSVARLAYRPTKRVVRKLEKKVEDLVIRAGNSTSPPKPGGNNVGGGLVKVAAGNNCWNMYSNVVPQICKGNGKLQFTLQALALHRHVRLECGVSYNKEMRTAVNGIAVCCCR